LRNFAIGLKSTSAIGWTPADDAREQFRKLREQADAA
jgi:hypothetical protein